MENCNLALFSPTTNMDTRSMSFPLTALASSNSTPLVNTDKDGNDTERWDWGKGGELRLHFRQTFDPKTKVEQFASFDPSGGMKLTWTEIGAHRNWTHRVIWVWSRSLGERKVYETDSRTISYWPQ